MPKRVQNYHSWLIKKLADSKEAERYLKVAAADSPEIFLKALRNVAEAKKISKVAEDAGVNRESLYRALSEEGNPRLSTLDAVLDALGMNLTVVLKQSATTAAPDITGRPSEGISFDTGSTLDSTTTITAANIVLNYECTAVGNPIFQTLGVPWYLIAKEKTGGFTLTKSK